MELTIRIMIFSTSVFKVNLVSEEFSVSNLKKIVNTAADKIYWTKFSKSRLSFCGFSLGLASRSSIDLFEKIF